MPGWKRSGPYRRLPANWKKICEEVLMRDRHACQWVRRDTLRRCSLPAAEVDHKVPRFEGGSDRLENLWALCEYHHAAKTAEESLRARRAASARRSQKALTRHVGIRD